jgi:hypothetical protein
LPIPHAIPADGRCGIERLGLGGVLPDPSKRSGNNHKRLYENGKRVVYGERVKRKEAGMTKEVSAKERWSRVLFAALIIAAGICFVAGNGLAENRKPLSVIQGTLSVKVGETVFLDGAMSSDPDGDSLNYTWTVLSWPKPGMPLEGKERRFQFDADMPGKYEIQLVVNDGFVDSDPVTVTVMVTDSF